MIIGDYNTSLNTDLDYVGYFQDPHRAFREFLYGLQDDGVFIDGYRFLYPLDFSYTCKVHNPQKRLIIDLAFANQNLIGGIREINQLWNHQDVFDHAMVTIKVDFETLAHCRGIFMCPSELYLNDS